LSEYQSFKAMKVPFVLLPWRLILDAGQIKIFIPKMLYFPWYHFKRTRTHLEFDCALPFYCTDVIITLDPFTVS